MPSVLQPWVMELPLRAQGTLLTGMRCCDVAPKNPVCIDEQFGCSTGEMPADRHLHAFLRYCCLVAADEREVDVPGAWFQSKPPANWKPSQFGHYPLHWFSHLMHCQPEGTKICVPTLGRRDKRYGPGYVLGAREVPIEELSETSHVVSWNPLSKLRLSGSVLSARRQRVYDGPLVIVRLDGLESRYTAEHPCVVRLKFDTFADCAVVYLMRRAGQYRIGRCKWRYCGGVGPKMRANHEGADGMWLLSVHATDREAALAESLAQFRFGIPGISFEEGGPSRRWRLSLRDFWSEVGCNRAAAVACLTSYGRLIDYPLWDAVSVRSGRKVSVVAAANLMSGMQMLAGAAAENRAWQPVEVARDAYQGNVFSLTVDQDHTYVADGLVTHNCFEVVAWCHPGTNTRFEAWMIYERLVSSLHLNPETKDEMFKRLELDRIAEGCVVS